MGFLVGDQISGSCVSLRNSHLTDLHCGLEIPSRDTQLVCGSEDQRLIIERNRFILKERRN